MTTSAKRKLRTARSSKDERRDAGRSEDMATKSLRDVTDEQIASFVCDCWFCNGDPDPWE